MDKVEKAVEMFRMFEGRDECACEIAVGLFVFRTGWLVSF